MGRERVGRLLAVLHLGAPITPANAQENWSLSRQGGRSWGTLRDSSSSGIKSRRVQFWGPVAIVCPSGKGLGNYVAYKVGIGGFGIVLHTVDPRWVAYQDMPFEDRPSLKFQIELRGYWRRPYGFFECPVCRYELYATETPTPDWHHQPTGDPHPGFSTLEPPMRAFALFRCSRCNRMHVGDASKIGHAIFGKAITSYQLTKADIPAAMPGHDSP
jgi:hypothetical protein